MILPQRWPRFIYKESFENGHIALSDLDTCEVFLNQSKLQGLPESTIRFIQAHEEGHVMLNTMNEMLADYYAFYKWVKYGYPLSDSLPAMSRLLDIEGNGEHDRRWEAHVQRIRMYDLVVNKNKAIAPLIGQPTK